jgi:D-glycerate 3-kinase
MNPSEQYQKIIIDEFDYDRLMFLYNLKAKYGRNYYHSNKPFFDKLNRLNAKIFNISDELRFSEFCEIYTNFSQNRKFYNIYSGNAKKQVEDLYNYYIPLARKLYTETYKSSSPIVIGIQGHQGCGKTTFCDIMKYILNNYYNIHTRSLSIDDIYLRHSELQRIKEQDKRFKFRGPPGTHDLQLGIDSVNKIKAFKYNFELPLYDKRLNNGLGDRSKEGELITKPIDLFILEGWFLGAEPVSDSILKVGSKDEEMFNFRKTVRDNLIPYTNLWRLVDNWLVLKPLKFKYSRKWRIDAELKNKQGMSYKQINEFVDYFWNALPPNIYFAHLSPDKKILLTIILDKYRNIYLY